MSLLKNESLLDETSKKYKNQEIGWIQHLLWREPEKYQESIRL
jgi:hypothetical protein